MDSKNNRCWLELDQKVSKLLNKNKKDETLNFSFRVKFFPENVEDEIIQQNTLQMFYLQVENVEVLFCMPVLSVPKFVKKNWQPESSFVLVGRGHIK